MISDVKDINICIVLLLVAFYEAASFPQPNGNSKAFHSRRDDVISGSVEIKEDGIEGNINIPNNPQQLAEEESAENGAVVGSIEINKDEVVGSISIPSGNGQGDNQHQSLDEHNEKAEGGVTTSIYQGVEIDGQDKKAEVLNNEVTQDGALSGTIEINDKNIEGNINIPSVEDDLSESGQEALETPGTGDFITGNIKINSEFIEGTIEVPSDTNDNDQVNADGVNNDGKQPHGGTITGSIEINDKAIEGHVDFPTDYEGSLAKETKDDVGYSKEVNSDVLTGSIEIGDEHIEGHVEMPSGVENDIEGEPNVSGANGPDKALSGTVEINDAGIQGHIDLPSEDDLVSSDENNSEDIAYAPITGTMKGWSHNPAMDKSCWMTLNAKHHMNALDDLDSTYKTDRQKYQEDIGKEFDKKMMEVLLTSQGKAPRAIHQAEGDPSQIPAGLALGGTCMMRMKGSVLFFHRMKLRNSTRFTVNFLNTDLVNMVQITRLSLNDLHLKGAYERLTSDRDPATLFYVPNFGEIEVLLKNVVYKMEGHLRMMNNRLTIELVNSDLITKDILMTYVNSNDSAPIVLQPRNIEDFLERLKTDLDFWLKDYFNDYLMYFGIVGKGTKVLEYEKKKTIRVNEYADDVVKSIKKRIKDLGAASVKLPHFTIFSVLNTEFKLLDGVLRGLDSIYRRSVATTKKTGKIRQLDFIAGFSELKVEYKYEALVSPNMPPISGKLIMSADEITAHIEIAHLSEPETIDIQLDTIIQTKPESLTVEGPVNRLIANFKALLEHPVIAIMSNTMKHNIKMMKTLTRCDPYIYGKEERISDDDPVPHSVNAPHQTDNDIEDDEGQSSASSSGNSDLGDGHDNDNDGGTETSKNDKDSSDYVLSKNDSLEIQVPVKGKETSYKLHRNEKLVLKKVDKYMK